MTTFHKALALLLALILLLSATACNKTTEPPADDSKPTQDDNIDSPQDNIPKDAVVLSADTLDAYQIVRSDFSKSDLTASAMSLRNAITQATGGQLTPKTDWEDVPEGIKEIIVGDTKRAASAGIKSSLPTSSFRICVVDGNVVICGTDDVTTGYAVTYFIEHFVTGNTVIVVPYSTDVTISSIEWLSKHAPAPVTYKKAYSDYITTYTEQQLLAFDDAEEGGYLIGSGGTYENTLYKEGWGALKWEATESYGELRQVLAPQTDAFHASVENPNTTTLKLWLFVNNTDLIACDHDAGYGVQKNQATFFFRVFDSAGRVHCWNHTLTNNGWHEIELSFNIHNGVSEGFDYSNVIAFQILVEAHAGAVYMIDDLRLVKYQTSYTPEPIEGEVDARLISDGEYDALDGAILQEWYGASYDLDDKVQGKSSLRNQGNSSVSDFRTIVANLDIPLNYDEDVLVFHLKIKKVSDITSFFIELNTVQDAHEYEASFTIAQLKSYGYTALDDTWCEIRIPLSAFGKNLGLSEIYGDTVQLHNFRFVANGSSSSEYDYHIDHIYLCKSQ